MTGDVELLDRRRLYNVGGIAALTAVLVGIVETSLTFLPVGTSAGTVTVVDWFEYAVATTDLERVSLVAAGQGMLSVGQSHTPGTFTAFLLADLAGIMMSVVMLRGKAFARINALLGIVGFALLLVFEVLASFVSGLDSAAWVIVMAGGLLITVWYVLLALRLFGLGNTERE